MVDFDHNRVKIDKSLVLSKSKGVYLGNTKTSDIRYLTLPRETMELLRQHKREQLRLQLANGDRWVNTGFVFTQDNGEHMRPDSITGWLNEFSARHGLPHINPMPSATRWPLSYWPTVQTLLPSPSSWDTPV